MLPFRDGHASVPNRDSSEHHGAYVAERPLSSEDVAATVYHHLGIDGNWSGMCRPSRRTGTLARPTHENHKDGQECPSYAANLRTWCGLCCNLAVLVSFPSQEMER
jgi:hypothetical protein